LLPDAVLHQGWRTALRDRSAGWGPKPPQAAAVKSRGGERCGKGALERVRCEPRRWTWVNHWTRVESVGTTSKLRSSRCLRKSLGETCLLPRRRPA